MQDISLREIHLTTRCNAKCPGCLRTIYKPEIKDLEWKFIQNIPILKLIVLVSHNGEPTLYSKFLDLIDLMNDNNTIIYLNSNFGTHNISWWYKLGKLFSRNEKSFACVYIDGLSKTYEKYRRGLSFEKVISNSKAFCDGGGNLVSTTILFDYNQFEIDEIEKLSYSIGCKEYRTKISWNYTDTFKESKFKQKKEDNSLIECQHLVDVGIDNIPVKSFSLYINGQYLPCCGIVQGIEFKKDKLLFDLYLKSYNDLFDPDSAFESDLFKYIRNNLHKIQICKKRCTGSTHWNKKIVERRYNNV